MTIAEFLFGPEGVNIMLAPLAIAGIGSAVGGIFGAFSAGRRRRAADREKRRIEKKIENLEKNRQSIVNPFGSVSDLSSLVSNPFQNLQVATGAAEFQASETDQSLASTLDTLRDTGAGAGGATALVRAAERSKIGISADIEKQEIENQRLRAEGKSRVEQIALSEGQRVQAAQVAGQQFMFGAREVRENQQLNRAAGQQEQAQANYANAVTAQDNAIGGLFGAAGAIGAAAWGGAFSSKPTTG